MEILTNFVAGRGADVGEERQGRVGVAAARVADGSFRLLCISTTNGGQISWVAGVTGEKLSTNVRGVAESCLWIWRCVPHDGQDTGRGLVGGDDATESHEGESESRLVEEHCVQVKGTDWSWSSCWSSIETRSRSESGEAG